MGYIIKNDCGFREKAYQKSRTFMASKPEKITFSGLKALFLVSFCWNQKKK